MFYGSRFYDPLLSRWTSPDSIIPSQTDPFSWDRFAYTFNNPVKYNDPSGHCPWCVVIGAIVGAAVGYGAQVVNNYQDGITGTDAWTTNISGEQILGGAVAGATIGLGVGIVSSLAGGALTAGGVGATAATAACGDGDCTNEARSMGASTTSAIQSYYPPNLGFSGPPQVTTLQPGEVVSRYGSTAGTFLSPAGTPSWARALPPGTESLTLNTYEVVKPIENVLSGTTASWWGKIGGGVQYYIGTPHGQNVQKLLDSGYLQPR